MTRRYADLPLANMSDQQLLVLVGRVLGYAPDTTDLAGYRAIAEAETAEARRRDASVDVEEQELSEQQQKLRALRAAKLKRKQQWWIEHEREMQRRRRAALQQRKAPREEVARSERASVVLCEFLESPEFLLVLNAGAASALLLHTLVSTAVERGQTRPEQLYAHYLLLVPEEEPREAERPPLEWQPNLLLYCVYKLAPPDKQAKADCPGRWAKLPRPFLGLINGSSANRIRQIRNQLERPPGKDMDAYFLELLREAEEAAAVDALGPREPTPGPGLGIWPAPPPPEAEVDDDLDDEPPELVPPPKMGRR